MKATGGKANPAQLNELLKAKLGGANQNGCTHGLKNAGVHLHRLHSAHDCAVLPRPTHKKNAEKA